MTAHPGVKLLRYCVRSQRLFIAAPYIKADALTRVLDAVETVESLICATRWTPHDLAVGVSDVECRTIIRERGGSFWLHPSLHAKYYRLNDVVLVGSANLTFPGMGWAAQSNLEILSLPDVGFDPKAFEKQLLKGAREISDDEFSSWQEIAKSKTEENIPRDGGQSLLYSWRPATRDPMNLEFSYLGKQDAIASLDEQLSAIRDIQAMQIPPCLNSEEVHNWLLACLLAAPFANTVISLRGIEIQVAARKLAQVYQLNVTEARRGMETVQNWLAFFGLENSL